MTCELVPENPNELTPAMRGRSPRVHGQGLVDNLDREPVPGDVRRRLVEVQVLRQRLVLERQDDLDDARDAGGRFQVPDVGLHRADQQRVAGVAPRAQCRTGGLDLDRVTQRCPGSVRLQVSDVAGGDTGALQRLGDDALLGDAVRHRQTTRCAILVDRAAPDHGPNPVTVADRVLEAFDDDDADALAAHVAVCGRVKGLALAIGREHVRLREGDHALRADQRVHAAGQRDVTFPEAQRLAGQVDGHQRRAARGID